MHKFSLRYYVLGDDAKTNFIKISIFFSEIVQPSISCFQLCCLPIIWLLAQWLNLVEQYQYQYIVND